MTLALVIGGADCVWTDYLAVKAICDQIGVPFEIFIINDMIPSYPGAARAVSLHPDKLEGWLSRRQSAGYPRPTQVWCHRAHRLATNDTPDFGGSSGLFAAKIAHHNCGFDRVILCGVPMTAEGGHFVRKQKWPSYYSFRKAWERELPALQGWLKSMSGWTKEKLGSPDLAWLNSETGGVPCQSSLSQVVLPSGG